MKAFAQLMRQLQEAQDLPEKLNALSNYFVHCDAEEAAWTIRLLTGPKLRRLVPQARLKSIAMQQADIEPWLYDECSKVVGDSAETLALIYPSPSDDQESLALGALFREVLPSIAGTSAEEQSAVVIGTWNRSDVDERIWFNKIITGLFRPSVDSDLVAKAIGLAYQLPTTVIHHRLSKPYETSREGFLALVSPDNGESSASIPFPFPRVKGLPTGHPLPDNLLEFNVEWKWIGIQVQVIWRQGSYFLWSSEDSLLSERFPEIQRDIESLPFSCVLLGDLVAEYPPKLHVSDILELNGEHLRNLSLRERRQLLDTLFADLPKLSIAPSTSLETKDSKSIVQHLRSARIIGAEGLILRKFDGSKADDSEALFVKPEELQIRAVLMYAERNADGGFSNFTFGVWNEDVLISIAKIPSDLTEDETSEMSLFIRENTLERIGPIRTVPPVMVIELGFDAIEAAPRRKAGILLRNPKTLRWQRDLMPDQADSLQALKGLTEG